MTPKPKCIYGDASPRNRLLVVACITLIWSTVPAPTIAAQLPKVGPVPEEVRSKWKLDPFYQKFTPVGDLPVVGSGMISDPALREAAYILNHLLEHRPELIQALATNSVKVVVMAHNEYTTDLPEQKDMTPRAYWDSRARGLGGPTCSGAEENLLCYPGDPYWQENILIHEFAHVIEGVGMKALDPSFARRLETAYTDALARGLWKGTYAGTNPEEYWAEAVQDWFDDNRHDDSLHNHVHTRSMLKDYDPAAAALCAEVFGDKPWRYVKPSKRPAAERSHLAGYDPSKAPHFRWRELPIPEAPRVVLETTVGEIELELNAKAAPATVSNFLHYVHNRLYNDGVFFRTVTLSNQPNNAVKIEVVQGRASESRTREFLPPIALERTRNTGLHHLDGTVSMARDGPDTAQHDFFICLGDQPELDFGGKRNPDGQGFAAFGKVVRGMELIRNIQTSKADGQQLTPPIPIQRAIRLN